MHLQLTDLLGRRTLTILLTGLALMGTCPIGDAVEDTKMDWWREARFGLFIHWGVYAVPAGTYRGESTKGNSEWIMLKRRIPVEAYRKFAGDFNPVLYEPEQWVLAAKQAGMKYIVITAKHHDGFALFDSDVSDWNVVDATPYGKDLLEPLAEACREHGMKLGFYYSQAQDWTHPGGAARVPNKWDPAQEGRMADYIERIAVPQVREILTKYPDLAVLWWDTPDGMTYELADAFLPLLETRPDLITNNRLITAKHSAIPRDSVVPERYRGDYATAERHIPATGLDYDWENCQTMQRSWGYNATDQAWKPAATLIRNLVDNASKGGNYLLNVGPKADGTFPPECMERLEVIGRWMDVNGESIYGTTASPFPETPWGRCTQKTLPDGRTRLYLHVFEWPEEGSLLIPGLKNQPVRTQILGAMVPVKAQLQEQGLLVSGLPVADVGISPKVIALDIQGALNMDTTTF